MRPLSRRTERKLIDYVGNPGFQGECRFFGEAEAAADPTFEPSFRLLKIWNGLAGEPPHRRSLDPVALGSALLPGMVLVELVDRGDDYRWRVFGSEHAVQYGADLTGAALSEIEALNPTAGAVRQLFDHVRDTAAPVFMSLAYTSRGLLVREAHGLMLPLSDDENSVGWICGYARWL